MTTRATWNGAVIAESDDVTIVDGYTYFPVDAIKREPLRSNEHHSSCPWKGTASYFDVVVDGKVNKNAAWCYPTPSDRAAPLVGGRVGFWRGVRVERDADARGGLLERVLDRVSGGRQR